MTIDQNAVVAHCENTMRQYETHLPWRQNVQMAQKCRKWFFLEDAHRIPFHEDELGLLRARGELSSDTKVRRACSLDVRAARSLGVGRTHNAEPTRPQNPGKSFVESLKQHRIIAERTERMLEWRDRPFGVSIGLGLLGMLYSGLLFWLEPSPVEPWLFVVAVFGMIYLGVMLMSLAADSFYDGYVEEQQNEQRWVALCGEFLQHIANASGIVYQKAAKPAPLKTEVAMRMLHTELQSCMSVGGFSEETKVAAVCSGPRDLRSAFKSELLGAAAVHEAYASEFCSTEDRDIQRALILQADILWNVMLRTTVFRDLFVEFSSLASEQSPQRQNRAASEQ